MNARELRGRTAIGKINKIVEQAIKDVSNTRDKESLEDVRAVYLGRYGQIDDILSELIHVETCARREVGFHINKAKNRIAHEIAQKENDYL